MTTARVIRPDPPVRPDGLCVCGKPRHPERSAKYAGGLAEADAFCRTECARDYHGCSLPFVRGPGTRAKALEEEAA